MTESRTVQIQVKEEAAVWYARMRSDAVSDADRVAFEEWISRGGNRQIYNDLLASLSCLDVVKGHPELEALRDEGRYPGQRGWRPFAGGIAALAAACALGGMLFQNVNQDKVSQEVILAQVEDFVDFETAVGETTNISLEDGSVLHLGSASRVNVLYTEDHREVHVEAGAAYFDVSPDEARPFDVYADGRRVTATGTEFDVRLRADRLVVTLVEGGVEISGDLITERLVLAPGDQYQSEGSFAMVRQVDAKAETAWHLGILDFRDVTLGEAVLRFNETGAVRILLADQKLSDLRIGGRFRMNDPEAFTAALAALYPVTAMNGQKGEIVISPRND